MVWFPQPHCSCCRVTTLAPRNRQGRMNPSVEHRHAAGRAKPRSSWLFQTPLLEGCISLNRINDGCSGTESHADEKKEQNSAKDAFQPRCAFWGKQFLQVSSAGLVVVWSTLDGWASVSVSQRGLTLHPFSTQRNQASAAAGRGTGHGRKAAGLHPGNRVLTAILVCFRDNN